MIYRDPTPAENQIFKKFERAVIDGRKYIEGYLAGCSVLAIIEQWRLDAVAAGTLAPGRLPPVFTKGRVAQARQHADDWNALESALEGLHLQKYGFQVITTPDGKGDLNIYDKPAEPAQVLEGWPLILLVTGVIVVAAAIAETMARKYNNEKDARDLQREILAIDQRMSKADPAARAAYARLKKTPQFTRPKSLLDKITEGVGGLAVLAVAGLALYALSKRPASRRAPVQNPCGGVLPPDQWDVEWSDDPEARERQLEYILDNLKLPAAQKWSDYFSYR